MAKNITRIISLSLLIITCIQIFAFSAQDGKKSSGLSKKIAENIINILPNVRNLKNDKKERIIENMQFFIRKLAHFSIYAFLGVFAIIFINTYNIKLMYKILICCIFGFIYAILDELHQSFIPGRYGVYSDVLIDTLGVIFGILIVLMIKYIIKRRKKKQEEQKWEEVKEEKNQR